MPIAGELSVLLLASAACMSELLVNNKTSHTVGKVFIKVLYDALSSYHLLCCRLTNLTLEMKSAEDGQKDPGGESTPTVLHLQHGSSLRGLKTIKSLYLRNQTRLPTIGKNPQWSIPKDFDITKPLSKIMQGRKWAFYRSNSLEFSDVQQSRPWWSTLVLRAIHNWPWSPQNVKQDTANLSRSDEPVKFPKLRHTRGTFPSERFSKFLWAYHLQHTTYQILCCKRKEYSQDSHMACNIIIMCTTL